MTKYVISTMVGSVSYNVYENINQGHNNGHLPVLKKSIFIQGGATLPSLRSGFGNQTQSPEGMPLWTSEGMVTPVSDDDYEILKDNKVFQKHLDLGLVKVVDHNVVGNHKKVAQITADMAQDGFRQLTPASMQGRVKVKTVAQGSGEEVRL